MKIKIVKEYSEDLRKEFEGYSAKKFSLDLMAGITVAAVALPLALAFGVSSGADAAAGLITAIIAGLLIGLLSGASFQISGPTGAMTAVLIPVVAQYGLEGMYMATLLAGVILLLAGLFKIGRLVSIIPMPVITGFTSGIAIIIMLGQVDNFFGTTSIGENAIEKLSSYGELGFDINWQVIAYSIFVVLLMILWPKKLQKRLPSSLVAIILVTIVNALILNWDVPLVGEIPRTLLPENRLSFADIDISSLMSVLTPALSIAALGMIESLLCGASGGRMRGEKMNADRELVAQGICSLAIPFFGGVPATAAIARTSVAIKSGQQTRLTSIIHALGLLLSMMVLAPIMSQIPMAALAGVLVVTAWRMNEWIAINHLFTKKQKSGVAGFLITMVSTVVFDLSIAILVGISFAAIIFTVKASSTTKISVTEVDSTRFKRETLEYNSKYEKIKVIYITGVLFFGSAETVKNQLEISSVGVDGMIFSLRGLSSCDTTGSHMLMEFCEKAKEKDIQLYFVGVQNNVMDDLAKAGIISKVGAKNFLWSTEDALELIAK